MSGNVHGGNPPVVGATVKLYAAGVTGTGVSNYGANVTLLGTTTTGTDGSFTFDNATTGASPCTVGQYLYITATGGDPGAGANNNQLALMAAIPTPCNTAGGTTSLGTAITPTASQNVFVNEVTTAATVAALQQFMTLGTSGVTIGAPSTNVTGLANAFAMVGNLVNIATGQSATSSTSNAVSSTLMSGATYTTIVNPNFAKLNTLADILATCVNTVSTTGPPAAPSTQCANLFADTTPSGGTAPVDTIQVMYNLMTNPAGLTMPQHGSTSPAYLCNTYSSSTAFFQPTVTCSTTYDWTIEVSYKTTNSSTSLVSTAAPGSIAIDASGDVWVSSDTATATGGAITEFNTVGQVMLTPVTSTTISTTQGWYASGYIGATAYTLGGARPDSLAIDTAGNVWGANYYSTAVTNTGNVTASSTGTSQVPLVVINPSTGTSAGYLVGMSPIGIAIDGNNNAYVTDNTTYGGTSTTSRFYTSELVAPGYSTFSTGVGRFTNVFNQIRIDQSASQYAIPFASVCSNAATMYRTDTSIEAAQAVNTGSFTDTATVTLSSTSSPTTCATYGAPDALNNIWASGGGADLEYINIASSLSSPTITTYASGTGTTFGGLDAPAGVSIDGLGNVWVANNVSSSTGGISEFTPGASGTTITAKSPAGTSVYGFGTNLALPHPVGTVIDGSGNVWIETTAGSYVYLLVGAAAPVVTPTSVQIKNNDIGVRP